MTNNALTGYERWALLMVITAENREPLASGLQVSNATLRDIARATERPETRDRATAELAARTAQPHEARDPTPLRP